MSLELPSVAVSRRKFLNSFGNIVSTIGAGLVIPGSSWADEDPALLGRPLVRYPGKTDLILLTSRPPQLETPMKYFEQAITPNEAFYVRYHTFPPPTHIDLSSWKLRLGGYVDQPVEFSLNDLKNQFSATKLVAVNQCSGNSRRRFDPRVFGGQWGDGAMGNAEWTGVRLQDLLQKAGVKAGAVNVAFRGFDDPAARTIPHFAKSLPIDVVSDSPDILVAYEMNGEPLPTLNGFPARLVVPGWFATYWVKHLAEITVLDHEFDSFWMKKAYRIPASPCECVEPGVTPTHTVPINRMKVRSFMISPKQGEHVAVGREVTLKGIAFDAGYGVTDVATSLDEGKTWSSATLGRNLGPYSFRQWSARWTPARAGSFTICVRAVNRMGESQPMEANWNPNGYLRNVVERIRLTAV